MRNKFAVSFALPSLSIPFHSLEWCAIWYEQQFRMHLHLSSLPCSASIIQTNGMADGEDAFISSSSSGMAFLCLCNFKCHSGGAQLCAIVTLFVRFLPPRVELFRNCLLFYLAREMFDFFCWGFRFLSARWSATAAIVEFKLSYLEWKEKVKAFGFKLKGVAYFPAQTNDPSSMHICLLLKCLAFSFLITISMAHLNYEF